jgi:hypothetical protein
MGEAFKPLGVYLNFFQPTLPAGATREFTVMMVNDEAKPQRGQLTLSLETKSGKVLAQTKQPFDIEALGAQTCKLSLAIPSAGGDCVLKATARAEGRATVSRRWLTVAK